MMRMRASIWLTVVLAATCLGAHAADLESRKIYEAARTERAPVIDGRLDDACWKQAPLTNEFVRLRGPEKIQQTSFQIAYDSDNLYIAVTCHEVKVDALQGVVRFEDQASLMGDDAVEMFLHPDVDKPEYYQLSANVLGTRYDGQGFDSSWNGDWRAKTTVGKDAWYLECAISFASLGRTGLPGMVWGLQMCRDRAASGEIEWSSWTPSPSGFHATERFGRLVFGGPQGAMSRATLIEVGRFAKLSLTLEEQITAALRDVQGPGAKSLEEEQRRSMQPKIAAAEASLAALRTLLDNPAPLDIRAWTKVIGDLQKASQDLEEAAWTVRFARLLDEG